MEWKRWLSVGVVMLVVMLGVVYAYKPVYTGDQYQDESASTKHTVLDGDVHENTKPNGWYSVSMGELFTENINTTFDFVGDDMPAQGTFGTSERKKLVHSVGSVANINWRSWGSHSYTGVFTGSNQAFLRFSLAKKPEKTSIVPGISVKFLRDGVESANVFAMYSLKGQSSFNFFRHDVTNHAPDLSQSIMSFSERKLYAVFQKASIFPTCLGISDLAVYNTTGHSPSVVRFPFRLIFHPTSQVHTLFPDAHQKGNDFFLAQLATLKPGTHVYDVYAQETPSASDEKIAEIYLTSSPTSSHFGDKSMFFQHTRMEDDLVYYPEWREPLEQILAAQRSDTNETGYAYPDLPFN